MDTTDGHLLAGRIRYRQPAMGFRTGLEPVLLAAAIAARPGERVLEAGTGAGAASLCLGWRAGGAPGDGAIRGVAIERNPDLARLAARNLADNGLPGIRLVVADVIQGGAIGPAQFDHAFANPPWHPDDSTASGNALRDQARRAPPGLERGWVAAMAGSLRHLGTLTLILPAARLPAWMAALAEASCGSLRILPLWPKAGRPAKLVLVRASRFGAGSCTILPGLTLHQEDGSYTGAADAVLRGGAPISLE